jgi:hypothetical protein
MSGKSVKLHSPPLSSRALFELTLFSTFVFILAALLMQFLLTLYTALLLEINHISFRYSLFAINFVSESSYSLFPIDDLAHRSRIWTEEQIYIIFGSGPVILTAVGVRLLFVLKNKILAPWKTRLALTWMAFLMVNALPCSIIAGALFYDGFGTAFQWAVTNYMVRGLAGLGVLLLLIIFSHFWQRQFLNTAWDEAYAGDEYHQRKYIRHVYTRPWIFGMFLLVLYNWPFRNLLWPAFLVTLGVLPLFNQRLRYQAIVVAKSTAGIFSSRRQVLILFGAIVAALASGCFKFDF